MLFQQSLMYRVLPYISYGRGSGVYLNIGFHLDH